MKKAFYKEPILQHFDISKLIRLKINVFVKAIEGVLWQPDKQKNQHLNAHYLRKMLFAKRNWKTHNVELLAIVESLKRWHHYLKRATYIILVLIDYNNLKKFIKITYLSICQIWWAQKLLHYDFIIDWYPKTNNLADVTSRPLIGKDAKKKLVKQNQKILNKLQQSLLENNYSLLNANCQAVTQWTMYNGKNYFWKYCIKMMKILIASIVASLKVKKVCSCIGNFLH